ncbi:hypothetical protein NVP3058O_119 [Vibrio phage 3.058.O._10N.286.46.B8]|nr:hypothetical protein NVP2058O_120 [Vibrio phage 2.058.O._10N.286.46.B8]AUS03189.1 hypothetical protein NVP3058O_119 [Vibrio phage 3.058.O._10N.286.46.B8]
MPNSNSKKILFKFLSDDSKSDGLDPWELSEKCVKGETQGLESKTVIDYNDGETVTIELEFDSRELMSMWVDTISPSYFPIAIQL